MTYGVGHKFIKTRLDDTYEEGYQDGYNEGYADGFDAGTEIQRRRSE